MWMLLRIGALVVRGLLTLRRFSMRTPQQRQDAIQEWSRRLLHACRVQLAVEGDILAPPALLAINHVSWLDIIALNAARPTRFVAKSDIDRWPLLGALARGAGTLFIERERPRDAMRVMHHMADALRQGEHVSVFPEGTTSDGRVILPLHANLFQAAVSADVPVQPVLLRYVTATNGAYCRAPAYVGDETMLGTLWRMACSPPLQVRVAYLESVVMRDRRELSRAVQAALENALMDGGARTQEPSAPLQSPSRSP